MSEPDNKLGSMPIVRLLITMSIPMMISFFVQALYNIVDSMFVARISEDALTAVSIAYPMQQLMTALGVGTGVAVNALVPRFAGLGKVENAKKIANTAVFLSACYTVLFIVIGLFLVRPFYTMQTDVTDIVEDGVQYLSIVCIVSVGCFFGQNFEKLLVATGNSTLSMLSQAIGAVTNIIFDPLLIFGIGPFPALGVRGAAIATVFGQIVAGVVGYCFITFRAGNVQLDVKQMLPTLPILRDIFSVAVPSMITVGLASVMSFGMNQILLGFSTTATAVFGIWLKLQNFSHMPIFGMNNGTVPILSFNYGAGNKDRVRQTLRIATRAAITMMAILAVIYECIPGPLLRLFSASETMISIGSVALRISVLSLPLAAFCLIMGSACQALGHSRYTLIATICRQLVFILPMAWLLGRTGNLALVWISIPAAEVLGVLLNIWFKGQLFRHLALNQ